MESSTARLFLVFAALVSLVSCATAADLQLELVSLVSRLLSVVSYWLVIPLILVFLRCRCSVMAIAVQ